MKDTQGTRNSGYLKKMGQKTAKREERVYTLCLFLNILCKYNVLLWGQK